MVIAKAHEIFSLTDRLTQITGRWNLNAQPESIQNSGDRSFCTQFKGKFLSRVVNLLLIFPTDLIDAIAHVAMGALTLLALAPGEAICNLFKDPKEKSHQFTAIGGLRNFGYALKHLAEAIPRAVVGIFNPGMANYGFQTSAQKEACFPKGDDEEFLLDISDDDEGFHIKQS